MTEFGAARAHMIESQLRPSKVIDARVLGAFAGIRRELFVSDHLRMVAYVDEDLPLGGGRLSDGADGSGASVAGSRYRAH